MDTLANLESFVRSAEQTPVAGTGLRSVATSVLERSVRTLTLTEAGERFLHAIGSNLEALQEAIAAARGAVPRR